MTAAARGGAPDAEHVDVLIVGAGLSGIGAACHLQQRCPERSFALLESRERSGGTWDLFRYPGVRSDSDMYTLGYGFRPWRGREAIAAGPSILAYVRETAREYGVDQRIRYRRRVTSAAWSTAAARWTVEIEADGGAARERMSCAFLSLCCGYYRYDAGYAPAFAGMDGYGGRVVHPQFWPEGLRWDGQRVVVIGSGATAMTLVPAMARAAAHVTMVQRSPTWVAARPSEDPLARRLRGWLPTRAVHALARWKQVLLGLYFFDLCRRNPERAKQLLRGGVRLCLGPEAARLEAHFQPRYDPWRQRLCLLPDADLFRALRAGKVSIETDEIERFTARGLALRSGRHVDADIVVTATGLELEVLGGIALTVDGHAVNPPEHFSYKGMMLSEVPNLAACTGYTNASWTLKADLTSAYVCRLLRHMRRHGYVQCMPRNLDPALGARPWIDFSSGYVQRSLARFPKQGARAPWRLYQNYLKDLISLRFGRLEDGTLQFRAAA